MMATSSKCHSIHKPLHSIIVILVTRTPTQTQKVTSIALVNNSEAYCNFSENQMSLVVSIHALELKIQS